LDSRIRIDRIRAVKVESVERDSKITYTIRFRDEVCSEAEPGQYVMIWVPSENECPMSLSEIGKPAAITVRPVGRATEKLCKKKVGEMIWVRGPYGRGFIPKGSSNLLIGGGTGIAPLMPLAEKLVESGRKVTLILAGQTADTIPLLSRAKRLEKQGVRLIYVTEDGSLGFRGVATDPLNNILKESRFDQIYTCGPEEMIKKVYQVASTNKIPIQASLERYVKCGISLCGSCAIGRYLVCSDGPVFHENQLKDLENIW